jgi:hypothetical protein
MRILTVIVGLILATGLDGCGITAKVRARDEMEQSKAAYKQCLTQHPQDPSQCEGARRAFEADMAAYRATSSGIRQGVVVDVQQSQ